MCWRSWAASSFNSVEAALVLEAPCAVTCEASETPRMFRDTSLGAGGGLANVFGKRGGGRGNVLQRTRDLADGRGLFLDGRGDRGGHLGNLLDDPRHFVDRTDGGAGVFLDGIDLLADFLAGGGGLAGQLLDLVGDHGETATGFARGGGLDRGIEREQVGLLGDVIDDVDDLGDLAGGVVQLRHQLLGRARLLVGPVGDFGALGAVVRHFLNGGRHFLHRGSDAGGGLIDPGRGFGHRPRAHGELFSRGGHGIGLGGGLFRDGGLALRGFVEGVRGLGERLGGTLQLTQQVPQP
jgi:hypothetical protein